MLNLEARFADIFGVDALPALDKVFLDRYEQAEDPRSKIFNMGSMDREIIQFSDVSPLGLFSTVAEGAVAPADSFDQSFNKTFTAVKYGMRIGISEEMIEDARFDLISKMVRSMARSAKETQLINAMNILNNSFTSQTAWDGVALVSASHLSDVGTQSNSQGTVDFAYSALNDAVTTLRKTKDNRGKQLTIKPKYVIVAEEGRNAALEIVKSPYKADTANNNYNSTSVGTDGLEVISSPYLTDADAWWVVSMPEDNGLHIMDRRPLSQELHDDKSAGVLYYISKYRQALGVADWRGVVGSAGNG